MRKGCVVCVGLYTVLMLEFEFRGFEVVVVVVFSDIYMLFLLFEFVVRNVRRVW